MYEKFWSGPTPMYAPPVTPARGERRHDVEIRHLVRNQIVGIE